MNPGRLVRSVLEEKLEKERERSANLERLLEEAAQWGQYLLSQKEEFEHQCQLLARNQCEEHHQSEGLQHRLKRTAEDHEAQFTDLEMQNEDLRLRICELEEEARDGDRRRGRANQPATSMLDAPGMSNFIECANAAVGALGRWGALYRGMKKLVEEKSLRASLDDAWERNNKAELELEHSEVQCREGKREVSQLCSELASSHAEWNQGEVLVQNLEAWLHTEKEEARSLREQAASYKNQLEDNAFSSFHGERRASAPAFRYSFQSGTGDDELAWRSIRSSMSDNNTQRRNRIQGAAEVLRRNLSLQRLYMKLQNQQATALMIRLREEAFETETAAVQREEVEELQTDQDSLREQLLQAETGNEQAKDKVSSLNLEVESLIRKHSGQEQEVAEEVLLERSRNGVLLEENKELLAHETLHFRCLHDELGLHLGQCQLEEQQSGAALGALLLGLSHAAQVHSAREQEVLLAVEEAVGACEQLQQENSSLRSAAAAASSETQQEELSGRMLCEELGLELGRMKLEERQALAAAETLQAQMRESLGRCAAGQEEVIEAATETLHCHELLAGAHKELPEERAEALTEQAAHRSLLEVQEERIVNICQEETSKDVVCDELGRELGRLRLEERQAVADAEDLRARLLKSLGSLGCLGAGQEEVIEAASQTLYWHELLAGELKEQQRQKAEAQAAQASCRSMLESQEQSVASLSQELSSKHVVCEELGHELGRIGAEERQAFADAEVLRTELRQCLSSCTARQEEVIEAATETLHFQELLAGEHTQLRRELAEDKAVHAAHRSLLQEQEQGLVDLAQEEASRTTLCEELGDELGRTKVEERQARTEAQILKSRLRQCLGSLTNGQEEVFEAATETLHCHEFLACEHNDLLWQAAEAQNRQRLVLETQEQKHVGLAQEEASKHLLCEELGLELGRTRAEERQALADAEDLRCTFQQHLAGLTHRQEEVTEAATDMLCSHELLAAEHRDLQRQWAEAQAGQVLHRSMLETLEQRKADLCEELGCELGRTRAREHQALADADALRATLHQGLGSLTSRQKEVMEAATETLHFHELLAAEHKDLQRRMAEAETAQALHRSMLEAEEERNASLSQELEDESAISTELGSQLGHAALAECQSSAKSERLRQLLQERSKDHSMLHEEVLQAAIAALQAHEMLAAECQALQAEVACRNQMSNTAEKALPLQECLKYQEESEALRELCEGLGKELGRTNAEESQALASFRGLRQDLWKTLLLQEAREEEIVAEVRSAVLCLMPDKRGQVERNADIGHRGDDQASSQQRPLEAGTDTSELIQELAACRRVNEELGDELGRIRQEERQAAADFQSLWSNLCQAVTRHAAREEEAAAEMNNSMRCLENQHMELQPELARAAGGLLEHRDSDSTAAGVPGKTQQLLQKELENPGQAVSQRDIDWQLSDRAEPEHMKTPANGCAALETVAIDGSMETRKLAHECEILQAQVSREAAACEEEAHKVDNYVKERNHALEESSRWQLESSHFRENHEEYRRGEEIWKEEVEFSRQSYEEMGRQLAEAHRQRQELREDLSELKIQRSLPMQAFLAEKDGSMANRQRAVTALASGQQLLPQEVHAGREDIGLAAEQEQAHILQHEEARRKEVRQYQEVSKTALCEELGQELGRTKVEERQARTEAQVLKFRLQQCLGSLTSGQEEVLEAATETLHCHELLACEHNDLLRQAAEAQNGQRLVLETQEQRHAGLSQEEASKHLLCEELGLELGRTRVEERQALADAEEVRAGFRQHLGGLTQRQEEVLEAAANMLSSYELLVAEHRDLQRQSAEVRAGEASHQSILETLEQRKVDLHEEAALSHQSCEHLGQQLAEAHAHEQELQEHLDELEVQRKLAAETFLTECKAWQAEVHSTGTSAASQHLLLEEEVQRSQGHVTQAAEQAEPLLQECARLREETGRHAALQEGVEHSQQSCEHLDRQLAEAHLHKQELQKDLDEVELHRQLTTETLLAECKEWEAEAKSTGTSSAFRSQLLEEEVQRSQADLHRSAEEVGILHQECARLRDEVQRNEAQQQESRCLLQRQKDLDLELAEAKSQVKSHEFQNQARLAGHEAQWEAVMEAVLANCEGLRAELQDKGDEEAFQRQLWQTEELECRRRHLNEEHCMAELVHIERRAAASFQKDFLEEAERSSVRLQEVEQLHDLSKELGGRLGATGAEELQALASLDSLRSHIRSVSAEHAIGEQETVAAVQAAISQHEALASECEVLCRQASHAASAAADQVSLEQSQNLAETRLEEIQRLSEQANQWRWISTTQQGRVQEALEDVSLHQEELERFKAQSAHLEHELGYALREEDKARNALQELVGEWQARKAEEEQSQLRRNGEHSEETRRAVKELEHWQCESRHYEECFEGQVRKRAAMEEESARLQSTNAELRDENLRVSFQQQNDQVRNRSELLGATVQLREECSRLRGEVDGAALEERMMGRLAEDSLQRSLELQRCCGGLESEAQRRGADHAAAVASRGHALRELQSRCATLSASAAGALAALQGHERLPLHAATPPRSPHGVREMSSPLGRSKRQDPPSTGGVSRLEELLLPTRVASPSPETYTTRPKEAGHPEDDVGGMYALCHDLGLLQEQALQLIEEGKSQRAAYEHLVAVTGSLRQEGTALREQVQGAQTGECQALANAELQNNAAVSWRSECQAARMEAAAAKDAAVRATAAAQENQALLQHEGSRANRRAEELEQAARIATAAERAVERKEQELSLVEARLAGQTQTAVELRGTLDIAESTLLGTVGNVGNLQPGSNAGLSQQTKTGDVQGWNLGHPRLPNKLGQPELLAPAAEPLVWVRHVQQEFTQLKQEARQSLQNEREAHDLARLADSRREQTLLQLQQHEGSAQRDLQEEWKAQLKDAAQRGHWWEQECEQLQDQVAQSLQSSVEAQHACLESKQQHMATEAKLEGQRNRVEELRSALDSASSVLSTTMEWLSSHGRRGVAEPKEAVTANPSLQHQGEQKAGQQGPQSVWRLPQECMVLREEVQIISEARSWASKTAAKTEEQTSGLEEKCSELCGMLSKALQHEEKARSAEERESQLLSMQLGRELEVQLQGEQEAREAAEAESRSCKDLRAECGLLAERIAGLQGSEHRALGAAEESLRLRRALQQECLQLRTELRSAEAAATARQTATTAATAELLECLAGLGSAALDAEEASQGRAVESCKAHMRRELLLRNQRLEHLCADLGGCVDRVALSAALTAKDSQLLLDALAHKDKGTLHEEFNLHVQGELLQGNQDMERACERLRSLAAEVAGAVASNAQDADIFQRVAETMAGNRPYRQAHANGKTQVLKDLLQTNQKLQHEGQRLRQLAGNVAVVTESYLNDQETGSLSSPHSTIHLRLPKTAVQDSWEAARRDGRLGDGTTGYGPPLAPAEKQSKASQALYSRALHTEAAATLSSPSSTSVRGRCAGAASGARRSLHARDRNPFSSASAAAPPAATGHRLLKAVPQNRNPEGSHLQELVVQEQLGILADERGHRSQHLQRACELFKEEAGLFMEAENQTCQGEAGGRAADSIWRSQGGEIPWLNAVNHKDDFLTVTSPVFQKLSHP